MGDSPKVPDLKKASQDKAAAAFDWTSGGTIAKSAASAAVSRRAPSALERLKGLGRGKTALLAAVLMLGGLAFSFAALRLAGTADGGGPSLGGISSSMKIRFASPTDPSRSVVREKAAAAEKMRLT